MSRSNYSEDCEYLDLYRGAVDKAIKGKRGQVFLQELADEMDRMSEKVLIAGKLIDESGQCCTIGVICKSRGIDVGPINYEDLYQVSDAVGIARSMAAEIAFENDDEYGMHLNESPTERWMRMRVWVCSYLQ